MRLFLYYAIHSFWGVLRKLAHTWVAVFLLVCLLIGAVVGLGTGLLMDAVDGDTPLTEDMPLTEEAPEGVEDIPDLLWEGTLPQEEAGIKILELSVTGGILLIFVLQLMNAEKSGGKIFCMADVNLLFPAPKKPQSVLMFRLCTQMGLYLIVTLYLTMQIPNLIQSFSLPAPAAWSLLIVFFFSLVFAGLLSLLIYTLVNTHPRLRGKVSYFLYGALLLLGAVVVLFSRAKGLGLWEGALAFFCAKWTRFVPVFGFLKAIPLLIIEQNYLWLGIDLAVLVLFVVGLCSVIWSIDADFYEDAISGAAEREELMQRAKENRFGIAFKKRKTRPEDTVRPLHLSGKGASVFFSKAWRTRQRGATAHLFTKTSFVYLFFGLAGGAAARFALQTHSSLALALPFCAVVFMRSFGNAIADDVAKPYFLLIPESAFQKTAFAMAGESLGTLFDLLPGLVAGEILLGAPVWKIVLWGLFLISFDFYTSSLGLFADLALPEAIPQRIKSSVQIMLLYTSVVPSALAIGIGALLGAPFPGVAIAVFVNAGIGTLFSFLSPMILNAGRK